MTLGKLAVYARKLHRILVLFISVLSLIMIATGLTLRGGDEAGEKPFINYNVAWSVHGAVSVFFAIVLGLMLITGLYLYLYPWIQKLSRPKPTT
jgi:hypothetical protein